MKVGVIGPLHPDSFADNILDSLPTLGAAPFPVGDSRWNPRHRLARHGLDMALRVSPSTEERLQRSVANRIIEAECDLVITVRSDLLPPTVRRLRDAGIQVALWFPDHLANLDRQLMLLADYTRVYLKDALAVQRITATTGLPFAYLPEACNPHWHRPIAGTRSDSVVLAGNMYPSRIRLLDRLEAHGVPLELYGAGFPRWVPQRPVMTRQHNLSIYRENKSRVFRNAHAVLNNLHPAELTSVNCRLFEASGAGAAVLCEDRPALRELFDVDNEVLAFATFDDLMEQIRRLAEDPDLATRIGNAATARAHAEHTYARRLSQILQDCA